MTSLYLSMLADNDGDWCEHQFRLNGTVQGHNAQLQVHHFCQCGKETVDSSDAFCRHCGHSINNAAPLEPADKVTVRNVYAGKDLQLAGRFDHWYHAE